MSIKDEQFNAQITEIGQSDELSDTQKRLAAGRALREAIKRLKDEGKSETEIADLLGTRTTRIRSLDHNMKQQELIERLLNEKNLSATKGIEVRGPWGHRALHGQKTPLYIFVPGGAKLEVGEVIAATENYGLKFEITLFEGHEDVESASFEMPMRFNVRKKETS